jgi:phosphomannomutase
LVKRNLVISGSGIRGIVYDGLSPELACRLASSFASLLGPGKYVIGRDTRPSGDILRLAVASGICATGGDVVDVGISPTPTIQLAVERAKARGGIAITASHNPAEWNALKLISSSGTFLTREEVDRVVRLSGTGEVEYASHDGAGKIETDTQACERHASEVMALDYIDVPAVRGRQFRVALDCTNGAGSVIAPQLLRQLGCDVCELDCEPSGNFRRGPEPLAENIQELCGLVLSNNADLGFALDPDADRLAVVDERGKPVGEEYTLVICADVVLGKTKGPFVTNLSTTMATEEVARKYGVEFHRTPIGEINVVTKMKAVGSPVGGEGNGGVILPALHYGRDAMVGMALVLEAIAEDGRPVSGLMNKFPKYAIFKEKVGLDQDLDYEAAKELLQAEFAEGSFSFDDGIRVVLGDKWLHIRRSGTEPVVRLIGEARTAGEAHGLVRRALELLKRLGGS